MGRAAGTTEGGRMKEYITKDRAKQFVCGHCNEVCSEKPCEPRDCDWMVFIDKEPAADVAPVRHGQWDGEGDGYADGEIVIDVWYCSECGYCIDDGTDDPNILPNYCPNCGALMDKEE